MPPPMMTMGTRSTRAGVACRMPSRIAWPAALPSSTKPPAMTCVPFRVSPISAGAPSAAAPARPATPAAMRKVRRETGVSSLASPVLPASLSG
jgi:hypothetical protein